MRSSIFAVLSVSSTIVAGSVIPRTQESPLQKRWEYGQLPNDNHSDVDSVCGHDPTKWDDRQVAADDWFTTGAGYWLDSYIKEQYLDRGKNPDNWLAKLNEEYSTDETDNGIWDCATIGDSQCDIVGACEDYFMGPDWNPEDGPTIPVLYYINFAAVQMHTAFSLLDAELDDWYTWTGFNVDQIVADFVDTGGDAVDPWALLSAAMGMASALTAEEPPVSATLGVISGAFGMIDSFSTDNKDPTASVQHQLDAYFVETKSAIQRTLNNAFGVSDGTNDYDIHALPAQTEEPINDTPIGRFFADGKWLMYNVGADLNSTIKTGNKLMNGGLAVGLLNTSDYFIFIDQDLGEDDCSDGSLTWLNGACYGVYSDKGTTCVAGGCTSWLNHMDDDKWAKLTDPKGMYDVDPATFYKNAYDCQKKHPDGGSGIDTGSLPYDGTLPDCFYNLEVIKGTFNPNSGAFDTEDL